MENFNAPSCLLPLGFTTDLFVPRSCLASFRVRNRTCQRRPAGTALQFNRSNQYVTFGAAAELGATNITIETRFY